MGSSAHGGLALARGSLRSVAGGRRPDHGGWSLSGWWEGSSSARPEAWNSGGGVCVSADGRTLVNQRTVDLERGSSAEPICGGNGAVAAVAVPLRSRLSNRRVSTDSHRVGCLRRARYHLSPRSRQALPPSSGKKTGSPQPVFQHKNWKLTASFPVKNRKPPRGGGRRRPGRRLARWRRTRPGRRDGGAGRCAAGSGRAGASPAGHTGSQERVVGPVPCPVRSGNKR